MDRAALINSLANEYEKDKVVEVKLDRGNYIEDTNSLDCTALGLTLDSLKKTRNVLNQQKDAYQPIAKKDMNAAQAMIHLEIAIKCVDEIIAQKLKKN